jgi:hypothetical protein
VAHVAVLSAAPRVCLDVHNLRPPHEPSFALSIREYRFGSVALLCNLQAVNGLTFIVTKELVCRASHSQSARASVETTGVATARAWRVLLRAVHRTCADMVRDLGTVTKQSSRLRRRDAAIDYFRYGTSPPLRAPLSLSGEGLCCHHLEVAPRPSIAITDTLEMHRQFWSHDPIR